MMIQIQIHALLYICTTSSSLRTSSRLQVRSQVTSGVKIKRFLQRVQFFLFVQASTDINSVTRRLLNRSLDSGVVELGESECKVNTNITLFNIRDQRANTLKIEFALCNQIITIQPPAVEDYASKNIQGDFHQFCFQTLNDFESMLNDTTSADVAIKVTLGADKIFRCHKFVLTGKLHLF